MSYTRPHGAANVPLINDFESAAEIPLVKALPRGNKNRPCIKPGFPTKRLVTRFVDKNELKADNLPIFIVRCTNTFGSAANEVKGSV